ncbi:Protein strawberry notch [Amphibalanus amphitrite]|uniref:Protein strawberry notch n=1 Tax=Amphibalanus amphitrite TaxID=1232801 RepID=A0A6A4UVJ8_AMPAM|nr:Protein strawberry notch [Amphibalanus amphitrite]
MRTGGGKSITALGDAPAPADLLSSALSSAGVAGSSGVNADRHAKIDRMIRDGVLTKAGPTGGQAGYQVISSAEPSTPSAAGTLVQNSLTASGSGLPPAAASGLPAAAARMKVAVKPTGAMGAAAVMSPMMVQAMAGQLAQMGLPPMNMAQIQSLLLQQMMSQKLPPPPSLFLGGDSKLAAPPEDEHGEEDDDDMGVVETYADYMPAKYTRFRLGPAESDEKVRCDEPDSAKHLLVDYPAYQGPRTRPWGPLPTLREILSTEAGLIRDFLVETGRVTRDDMLKKKKKKKKKKKHRPEDATESVFSEDESESLPVSASMKLGRKHPDPVVETASLASVPPTDVWYRLSLPEELISQGRLSALQLEAVVYSCQAHSQFLQDGTRAGFLVGDGAGVGKGRTIAGLIYENYLKGRKKAIWVSVSNDLKYDAERDLSDIGAGKISVYALNKSSPAAAPRRPEICLWARPSPRR